MTYHLWTQMTLGDEGDDVMHLQRLLAGGDRRAYDAQPGTPDGVFGTLTASAVRREKFHLGYPSRRLTPIAGQRLRGYLVDKTSPAYAPLPVAFRLRMLARRGKTWQEPVAATYPLAQRGTVIGRPYQGTHHHPDPHDSLHNWESCNALDLATPTGTPVIAVADGTIGPQIGPLSSTDPVLLGLRLHLVSADNEWYFAHLSKLEVTAGAHVSKGDRLGLSGSANGVQHLHFGERHGDPGAMIGDPSSGYVDQNYP
jgi:murein DD-endopeptidase MepM/ murein hydrolase activator NlpD